MIYKIVDGIPVLANLRRDFPTTSFPVDLSTAQLPDGYVWAESTAPPACGKFERAERVAPIQGEDGTWRQAWQIVSWTDDEMQAWRAGLMCGPLQLRRALRQTGDHAAVQAAIVQADEEMQEAWEYASEIWRTEPMIETMRGALGKTAEEVDDLFLLAQTL
jgi:hypothetical protein